MKSRIRNSFVETTSIRSSTVSDVYTGSYDFSLGSASWDKRSVSIASSEDFNAKFGVLFHFKKKDHGGRSEEHKSTLEEYFHSRVENLTWS